MYDDTPLSLMTLQQLESFVSGGHEDLEGVAQVFSDSSPCRLVCDFTPNPSFGLKGNTCTARLNKCMFLCTEDKSLDSA